MQVGDAAHAGLLDHLALALALRIGYLTGAVQATVSSTSQSWHFSLARSLHPASARQAAFRSEMATEFDKARKAAAFATEHELNHITGIAASRTRDDLTGSRPA